jgi:putative ABC transport system permease protein
MRAGLGGFYVFVACMALGVAVIAAVGALGDALKAGFEKQGELILGGDVTVMRTHQRANASERAWLDGRGRVSETATMRSMARLADGSDQTLIELKAADDAYPLIGRVEMMGGGELAAALARPRSAVVDPLLLERLKLKLGDTFRIGTSEVRIAGVVTREPDAISDRVTYGPRVLISIPTLMGTGLVQPGSLIRWRYAVKLPNSDVSTLTAFRPAAVKALPESGFLYADRREPSPRITRTLERLRQFLTLIGLTSLLIGGVGVANAVATFVDRRRKVIATMKSLGASGRTVLGILLCQVMMVAAIGIGLGLVVGYAVPSLLDRAYGDALPVRAAFTVAPLTVGSAVLYGVLVAAMFTLWPLGRTERIRAGALFREEVAPERVRPPVYIIVLTVLAGAAMLALAILGSDSRKTAIYFLGAVAGVFVVFLLLGTLVGWGARRVARPKSAELRLALGNIGAPGGLTRSVILSLGAGLSLLVAVALVDASLVADLSTRAPKESPTYFVLDIKKSDRDAFVGLVRAQAPEALIDEAPMLRGRIVRLKGELVERMKVPPEAQWVLNGDRGLTYSEEVPDGSKVTDGEWWPKNYSGEPLVSFEGDLAKRLKLKVGDTVTVNVLGRNVTARISSLREVKWESLAINFVMVFSPNTLRAAPHNLLATVRLPEPVQLKTEAALSKAVAQSLPSITMIRVKDALEAFLVVFGKVMVAVRVAGGVTLVAGALVLAGALATAQRRRIKQAVILKTIGATRRRILTAHLLEYGMLALSTAGFAVILGSLSAWVAVTQVMELDFEFSLAAVLQALIVALSMVLVFGCIGTWVVLRAPSVPHLRAE